MNEAIPKLLRAVAGGMQAKENKHDVIFNAAADEIERLRASGGVIADIIAERQRQMTVEGWTLAHDDSHEFGELRMAAACYAQWAGTDFRTIRSGVPNGWPWDSEWWKQKNERRDLIVAAALLVAEIERLDRATADVVPQDR